MSDVQTFIEVKQHPQAGPETPPTMCEKFEDFLKNSIFDYFLTFCHGGPPPWLLITVIFASHCKKILRLPLKIQGFGGILGPEAYQIKNEFAQRRRLRRINSLPNSN